MAEQSANGSWPEDLPKPFRSAEHRERRDAREHRQRILEVARQLFEQYGVNAVSMHQIAVGASIGQGTLYRRYAHKSELCQELLQEQHQQFIEEIAVIFTNTEIPSRCDQLKAILAHTIAFLEEQDELLGATTLGEHHVYHKEHNQSCHYPPLFNWLYQVLIKLLNEAVDQGEFAPIDVVYTADALIIHLHPLFYHRQRWESGFTPERILQGLYRIYIDGLQR